MNTKSLFNVKEFFMSSAMGELAEYPNWTGRDGKVPLNANYYSKVNKKPYKASFKKPGDWSTFQIARAAYGDNVSFVLGGKALYNFQDLDKCIGWNGESFTISQYAKDILALFPGNDDYEIGTYIELSQSWLALLDYALDPIGKKKPKDAGLHILTRGELDSNILPYKPDGIVTRHPEYSPPMGLPEMYSKGFVIAMTGLHLPMSTPYIADFTATVNKIYQDTSYYIEHHKTKCKAWRVEMLPTPKPSNKDKPTDDGTRNEIKSKATPGAVLQFAQKYYQGEVTPENNGQYSGYRIHGNKGFVVSSSEARFWVHGNGKGANGKTYGGDYFNLMAHYLFEDASRTHGNDFWPCVELAQSELGIICMPAVAKAPGKPLSKNDLNIEDSFRGKALTIGGQAPSATVAIDSAEENGIGIDDACNAILRRKAAMGVNGARVQDIPISNGVNGFCAPIIDTSILPKIKLNGRLTPNIMTEVIQAFIDMNDPPSTFIRAGQLAKVAIDEIGNVKTITLDTALVENELSEAAWYYREHLDKKTDTVKESKAHIPRYLTSNFTSRLNKHEFIPALTGVVTSPYFYNGKLVSEPGYCADSRLFYHNDGLELGDCEPTQENIKNSLALINSLLVDFPFADQSSRANAIALMILPFVRPMISGPTPLHCVDSPTPGTGKGLLCNLVTRPFNKRGASSSPSCGLDKAEWKKTILTLLRDGPSHICFDNVSSQIDSDALNTATTEETYKDRILGKSESLEIKVTSVWMMNGNNISLGVDTSRRVVWIRLNAELERPDLREVFKIPNLPTYVLENRSAIVTAIITLINNWVVQGMKESSEVFGSFERYAGIMGGILEANNIEGFLGNRNQFYEQTNTENSTWRLFVDNWAKVYKDSAVTVGQLFKIASYEDNAVGRNPFGLPEGCQTDILGDYLGDGKERSRASKLGKLMSKSIDKVFGGYKIAKEASARPAMYRLVKLGAKA